MVKIVFIQDMLFEYMGPLYLSSYLKKRGHECEILVANEEKDIIEAIKKANPDAIAFSIMSTSHKWAFDIAKEAKRQFKAPIIFGGPHPTFFPEIINYPFVDVICIGEGEEALADFADGLNKKRIKTNIPNLWIKKGKKIYKNPVRRLVENLDELPFPDREALYSKYEFLKRIPTKRFLASRGCPYNCTYCFNHKLKEIYRGKGRYVRKRSVGNLLKEIKEMRKKYPLKTVRFVDDTFTLDKKWLYEFLEKYEKEISLPFTCLARANEVDERLIKKLKEAGCVGVTFGIESGNERIRNTVLCKNLTDKDIISCGAFLRKYKIKFGTYNMICLPGETLDDAFETIKLNAKIKVDNPMCAIFQPFPKTELTKYAIKHNLLDKDFNVEKIGTVFGTTPLKIPNKKEFVNLHKFFMIGVMFPFLLPLIKIMIKLPNNVLFNAIYKISYGIRAFKSYNVGIFTALKLGLKLKDRFKEPEKEEQE